MTKIRQSLLHARAAIGSSLVALLLCACAASAPRSESVAEGVTRIDLGAVKVTALSDGSGSRTLDAGFVRNAPLSDVQASLREMGLPTDRVNVSYTVLLVETGGQRILLDTGNGEFGGAGSGRLQESLRKAGVAPQSISAVVISHFHGDHINGLRNKAGELSFPNARIYVPAPEWNWWMDEARYAATPENARGGMNTARRVFAPLADKVVRFEPGAEILPGVRSIAAFGHTPGHTAFMIEGGSRKLLYWADVTNIDLFVRNPDWAVLFDMDPEAARLTRHRIARLAIAENALVAGYHLSGGIGTLSALGKGYDFQPLR